MSVCGSAGWLVRLLVGSSVGLSKFHMEGGGKVHFHAPVGALISEWLEGGSFNGKDH